ncbi:MAG: PorT family protein [Bergeyella sp.]|nr:PorT family protein [Bergeyella sp.]
MKRIITLVLFIELLGTSFFMAQFRTRNRMDNLEGFDKQQYSWGFYLVANQFDYKIVLDPKYGMSDDGLNNLISSKPSMSFGAGLIGKMRLNDSFDLRFEPGLQFVQRDLTFNTQKNSQYSGGTLRNKPFDPLILSDTDKVRVVKSTYIDMPLLLEYHGDRWYNSRPFFAAGVNYLVNLQSNQTSTNDNLQKIFRSTTHNFGWTVEMGFQFYFHRFKFTPAVRGTFFTNNELVKDNPNTPPYWASGISSAQSRAFMLVLKFE